VSHSEERRVDKIVREIKWDRDGGITEGKYAVRCLFDRDRVRQATGSASRMGGLYVAVESVSSQGLCVFAVTLRVGHYEAAVVGVDAVDRFSGEKFAWWRNIHILVV
jgi:hypothetical protein